MACSTSAIQRGLNLTSDNIYGPQTRAAVVSLQRGVGANPDGQYFGPDTEGHVSVIQTGIGTLGDGCWGSGSNAHCRVIQSGVAAGIDGVYGPQTRGNVQHAQDLLRSNGCDPGPSDGLYGNGTHGAVACFQSKRGLAADGLLGPITGAALGIINGPGPGPPPGPGPGGTFAGAGVDVYEGNGDINWNAVRGTGRNGAYIKINEGTSMDSRSTNGRIQAMDQAGIRVGGYDFIRVRTDRSGADEARMFLDRMRAIGGGLRRGDLAPCADFEVSNGFGVSVIWPYLQSWASECHRQGFPTTIYCSPSIWSALTPGPNGSTDNLGSALWVAHYGVSHPTIPVAWNHADGWQFADSGVVAGISPPTDLDNWYSMPTIA